MSLRHHALIAAAILTIATSGTAAARENAGDVVQPPGQIELPGTEPDGALPPRMLTPEELAETRGRATIVINNQTMAAITSGNQLGNYVAGTITLSDNALSSFSGVGNFLFNTGAQNSLQTGMTLTITIE